MSPLLLIVAIVLVDLLGFTLAIPLLPRFADDYGFGPWQIAAIMTAYPACQLLAGPVLGRLSDRFGRRPVLIFSHLGTSTGFLLMGLSTEFWVLLLARMIDGASGGNILVAQAYVADVTKPEERSRGLGLLGAAFGVGFVLGPLLGGLLVKLPVDPAWQSRVPFLVAAGFSTLAWLLVIWKLPESLPSGRRPKEPARFGGWGGTIRVLGTPQLRRPAAVGALIVLAFAALEGTFSIYLKKRLGWSVDQAAFGFAALGLVGAIAQGGLIRPLARRYGEARLVRFGLVLMGFGFAAMATVQGVIWFGVAALLIGTGYGLASPSAGGLLSRAAGPEAQGAAFGAATALATTARMINYGVGNVLIGLVGPSAPYWGAVGVTGLAWLAAQGLRAEKAAPVDELPAAVPGGV